MGSRFPHHRRTDWSSGSGFVWIPSWSGGEPSLLLPAALLVLGVFLPQVRRTHLAMAIAASLLLAGLVWLAGAHALQLAETGSAISRTSFNGGFWLLVFFSWLAAVDSIQRLRLGAPATILANAAVIAPTASGLLLAGELAQLSLLKEYANRRDVFYRLLSGISKSFWPRCCRPC